MMLHTRKYLNIWILPWLNIWIHFLMNPSPTANSVWALDLTSHWLYPFLIHHQTLDGKGVAPWCQCHGQCAYSLLNLKIWIFFIALYGRNFSSGWQLFVNSMPSLLVKQYNSDGNTLLVINWCTTWACEAYSYCLLAETRSACSTVVQNTPWMHTGQCLLCNISNLLFLPHDVMPALYMLLSCVCLSVTSLSSTKMAKPRITQTTRYDRTGTSFLMLIISVQFQRGHPQQRCQIEVG